MRRPTAVLLALTVVGTLSACAPEADPTIGQPVQTLDQLSAVLKGIGVCPKTLPHVDTPFITLDIDGTGTTYSNASFACQGKALAADGFPTAELRDKTAANEYAMIGGPHLVGTGNNLWILGYDKDEKGDTSKIMERFQGKSRVVLNS